MLNFTTYRKNILTEAIKVADTEKVGKLITSYLRKKLGQATLYPAIEQFKHGGDTYTTLTILLGYPKSVRFNWLHGKIEQSSLHSVTIDVEGKRQEITFDKDVSLVQTLPQITRVLQNKVKAPEEEFFVENVSTLDDVLAENMSDESIKVVMSYISNLKRGAKVNLTTVLNTGGPIALKLMRQVIDDNPKTFSDKVYVGGNVSYAGAEALLQKSKVKMSIKSDTSTETWIKPESINSADVEEQISYIEKIADLGNMVKFMLKGATNAIFVAGRGGCLRSNTEINIEM